MCARNSWYTAHVVLYHIYANIFGYRKTGGENGRPDKSEALVSGETAILRRRDHTPAAVVINPARTETRLSSAITINEIKRNKMFYSVLYCGRAITAMTARDTIVSRSQSDDLRKCDVPARAYIKMERTQFASRFIAHAGIVAAFVFVSQKTIGDQNNTVFCTVCTRAARIPFVRFDIIAPPHTEYVYRASFATLYSL